MSECEYLTENLCQEEWADALEHFESTNLYLERFQIDILNCSKPGGLLDRFPHCCSDAGVEEFIGKLTL